MVSKRKMDTHISFPDNLATEQERIMKIWFGIYQKWFKKWFKNAIENARLCPTAQEHENKVADLDALYDKMKLNGKAFVDNLSVFGLLKSF